MGFDCFWSQLGSDLLMKYKKMYLCHVNQNCYSKSSETEGLHVERDVVAKCKSPFMALVKMPESTDRISKLGCQ